MHSLIPEKYKISLVRLSTIEYSITKHMAHHTFIEDLFQAKANAPAHFGDKRNAEKFADDLFSLLFIRDDIRYTSKEKLEDEYQNLQQSFVALISHFVVVKEVDSSMQHFFSYLPSIRALLIADAEATAQFDPAASSTDEVILAYPGFYATAIYRLSHHLFQMGVKTLPRILSEYAHSKTGIDIHPGAVIGSPFIIDHGTGIVIGETSEIGANVKIYQGVTLGALNVEKSAASQKRHPTIQDNVIIYSGATILGGGTVIGESSIIGGNVWLTYSVPAHSVVYRNSEIKVRDNNPLPEGLNFVI